MHASPPWGHHRVVEAEGTDLRHVGNPGYLWQHVAYQAILQGVRPDVHGRRMQGPAAHRLHVWSATEDLGPFVLQWRHKWNAERWIERLLRDYPHALPPRMTMVKFTRAERWMLSVAWGWCRRTIPQPPVLSRRGPRDRFPPWATPDDVP